MTTRTPPWTTRAGRALGAALVAFAVGTNQERSAAQQPAQGDAARGAGAGQPGRGRAT